MPSISSKILERQQLSQWSSVRNDFYDDNVWESKNEFFGNFEMKVLGFTCMIITIKGNYFQEFLVGWYDLNNY